MIYLDNAATTRVLPEVFEAMRPWFCDCYANPSGIYRFASEAKAAVENARRQVARVLGVSEREIYFTGGGSESDNWALKAAAEASRSKGNHIITTRIEHHAILHTCQWLEKQGWDVTYLEVDGAGRVDPAAVRDAIRPDTILISVMTANNEIGTIEPIGEIGEIARSRGILFHTDAVQAFGHIPIPVQEWKVDMLSASGHKFHGPKGAGFLYVRKGIPLPPLIHGGSQERNRRAGTTNVPGIVGMGKAAEICLDHMEEWKKKQEELRDYMIQRIKEEIPCCELNGEKERRLPNNINMSFRFVEGESLLIMLDSRGVAASAGSACTSGSLDPSHVLLAIGCSHERAQSSLRMTLSEETTRDEAEETIRILKESVERLRSMSPLYNKYMEKTN